MEDVGSISGTDFHHEHGNPIHVLQSPVQELKKRVTKLFQQMVGARWSCMKEFAGLQNVNPGLSKVDAVQFCQEELGA